MCLVIKSTAQVTSTNMHSISGDARRGSSQNGRNSGQGDPMKTLSAREAKYNFGQLIDTARAGPVVVEKHGGRWSSSYLLKNTDG